MDSPHDSRDFYKLRYIIKNKEMFQNVSLYLLRITPAYNEIYHNKFICFEMFHYIYPLVNISTLYIKLVKNISIFHNRVFSYIDNIDYDQCAYFAKH